MANPLRSILEFDNKEANILILEKGFPYFTRDIKLMLPAGEGKAQEEFDAILFRLINEVRVSLDYYKRQFLKKDVDEMLIISSKNHSGWVDNFTKELGLKVDFVSLGDVLAFKDVREDMFSDAGKAFGAALRVERPSLITLNLWKAKDKSDKAAALALTGMSGAGMQEAILEFLKSSKRAIIKGVIIAGVIIALGYGAGSSKVVTLEKELAAVSVNQLPLLSGVDFSSLETVKESKRVFIEKNRDIESIVKNYLFFYKKLLLLSRLLPEGVWINAINYSSNPASLRLSCYSYAQNLRQASENINKFIINLKGDPEFTADFSIIDLRSYRETSMNDIPVMQFDVSCEKKTGETERAPTTYRM